MREQAVLWTGCAFALVRSRRLELPRPFGHSDLNAARLPVPPRPHVMKIGRRSATATWQGAASSKGPHSGAMAPAGPSICPASGPILRLPLPLQPARVSFVPCSSLSPPSLQLRHPQPPPRDQGVGPGDRHDTDPFRGSPELRCRLERRRRAPRARHFDQHGRTPQPAKLIEFQ